MKLTKNQIKKQLSLNSGWLFFLLLTLFLGTDLFAQSYSLSGNVIDSSTKKNVTFAIIIVQEAGLVVNAPQGKYYVSLPRSGTYTVKVQSTGLQSVTTSIVVSGNTLQDFYLSPFISKGSAIVIRGERDVQKISRHTMTVKQIKEVPASFGDSLNALTSLPSVSRPFGIFGPLVIRGADDAVNGYYIDDIPIFNPMHFGGFHSVINNDLIREIDLYSSAYPSQFSNSQGAIININTIDEVEKRGGNVDVGLISASVLLKEPLTETTNVDGKEKIENKGYIIAGGRVGYLTIFIPLFYEYVLDQNLEQVVEYYDYQFKAKYKLDEQNFLTFLSFGSKDKIKLIYNEDAMEEGDDPLWEDMVWKQNQQSHNVGLYYTFTTGKKFSNTLMSYGAMTTYYRWADVPKSQVAWAHDLGTTSRPFIFGVKDKLDFEWWENKAKLKAGVEFNYYRFNIDGKMVLLRKMSEGNFDPSDPDLLRIIELDDTIENYTFVYFVENKFIFGPLSLVPGLHSEYLKRTDKMVIDPRGAATLSLKSGTTLGVAGGYYSHFIQTNGNYFNHTPMLAGIDYLDPQRAIHRSLSIEQKFGDYTVKLEGFNNEFWDLMVEEEWADSSGNIKNFRNCAEIKSRGFELMGKVNDEGDKGLFGWLSYTYTNSRFKSNMFTDSYGDQWLHTWFEQVHVLKAVAGYTSGSHTLSARFQFNSSLPYTPIINSTLDTTYSGPTDRYVPEYGTPHSKTLPFEHRLDLRYSYRTIYKWGFVSWYFEIINVYNYRTKEYRYDYRYPYEEGKNPRIKKTDDIAILPNFGVEAKF